MKKISLATLVLFFAACAGEGSPVMRPGEDCSTCHNGDKAPLWTAAGTVYGGLVATPEAGLQGVTVEITDATNNTVSLLTNVAGNFYTAETLKMPIRTAVRKDGVTLRADAEQPRGACNSCHGAKPTENAKGRLYWATSLL